jgi:hypothetical protein
MPRSNLPGQLELDLGSNQTSGEIVAFKVISGGSESEPPGSDEDDFEALAKSDQLLYQAFKNQGFTPDQSFQLLLTHLRMFLVD